MPMERGIGDDGLKRVAKGVTAQEEQTDQQKRQEYWATVKTIAEEIKQEWMEDRDLDIHSRVFEDVDGSWYIIYYHANMIVLDATDNEDALDNAGVDIDTSQGWRHILTQVAFYAMEADVYEALAEIGWDGGESFEGVEDEEEEDEEEF